MKKVFYPLACLAAGALVACGGQKSGSAQADQPNEVALAYSKSAAVIFVIPSVGIFSESTFLPNIREDRIAILRQAS